ncbi:MAG: hypothetical protein MUF35_03210 [Candidatus Nanopelagicales bacterium]|jgi:hypothetical protein|nr:hypothetical protein [Candidatus Nanopelagicales bacterium]
MSAIAPDAPAVPTLRVISLSRVQRRLGELTREGRARAGWWVEITRQLDDLAETVLGGAVDVDVPGMTEQLRADAPHLITRWQRIAAERDELHAEVTAVRQLAGTCAGDPQAVTPVSHAIQDLLLRVRRFQERTSDVLYDAYARDLGGE